MPFTSGWFGCGCGVVVVVVCSSLLIALARDVGKHRVKLTSMCGTPFHVLCHDARMFMHVCSASWVYVYLSVGWWVVE
jgi:hypothetical protein